jgi:hypothetical protein
MLIMTHGQIDQSQTIKWQADIWEGYGDNDPVQTELKRIAEAVEAMCKPILTEKSPVSETLPIVVKPRVKRSVVVR